MLSGAIVLGETEKTYILQRNPRAFLRDLGSPAVLSRAQHSRRSGA
jgi:hypothetical protein